MPGFYLDVPTEELRLGDIVTGFPVTVLASHGVEPQERTSKWTLAAETPQFAVIMTPCCALEKESMLIAPLQAVPGGIFENEHFAADPLMLNRKQPFDIQSNPRILARLTPEEIDARRAMGDTYAQKNFFIYAPHTRLPMYKLGKKTVRDVVHYAVDFKSMCRINCDQIVRKGEKPITKAPPNTKFLELTVQSRELLRLKIADYFGGGAEEDLLELQALRGH